MNNFGKRRSQIARITRACLLVVLCFAFTVACGEPQRSGGDNDQSSTNQAECDPATDDDCQQCQLSSDCDDGFVCQGDVCVEDGVECQVTSDCDDGFVCQGDQCVEDEAPCTDNTDCNTDEICDFSLGDDPNAGQCVDDGSQPECQFHSDCDDGELCDDTGSCVEEVSGDTGQLFVDPQTLQFIDVPAGSIDWQVVEVSNIGSGELAIDDIFVSAGTDDYSISFVDGVDVDASDDLLTHPDTLAAGDDPILVRVWFEPDDTNQSDGTITIDSDDPDTPQFSVDMVGNSGQACLDIVTSTPLYFGITTVGYTSSVMVTIFNCSSTSTLSIDSISMPDDGGGVFGFDTGSLPSFPLLVPAGDSTNFVLIYSPNSEQIDNGQLLIESNDAADPAMNVNLTGEGVDNVQCPIAEATGSVGGDPPGSFVSAEPQDIVDLSSTDSSDPNGQDLTYEWALIDAPSSSLATIDPSTSEPNPEILVDVVGDYTVELIVYNEDGIASCDSSTVDIEVNTDDEEIFVQLTWIAPAVETAGGASNGQGTDLDLHYHHPDGDWGDDDLSVYWQQTSQDWNDHGTATLDIDSMWGDTPETVTHVDPKSGENYSVGVHYYSDNGYGRADATVEIYYDGVLYGEYEESLMDTDHFWHVGDVQWGATPTFDFIDDYSNSSSLPSADGM